jgi:hypothetical protein
MNRKYVTAIAVTSAAATAVLLKLVLSMMALFVLVELLAFTRL